MSFILGINLSDRVYLSGDTRLTTTDKDGVISVSDNLLKVQPLSNTVSCAAAGDARLASFLTRELYEGDTVKWGIRYCRTKIEERVKFLMSGYENSFKSTILIFGGLNLFAAKKITQKKLVELTKFYSEETNKSMNMKEVIFQGLLAPINQGVAHPILPCPDSHVFAVKILPTEVLIEDVEWGEFIARGDNLSEVNLPTYTFGEFEIAGSAGDIQHDNTMLAAFLKHAAEEQNVLTVGGSITTLLLSGVHGSGMITGNIDRINMNTNEREYLFSSVIAKEGKFYRRTKNRGEIELIPLKDFNLEKGEAQLTI